MWRLVSRQFWTFSMLLQSLGQTRSGTLKLSPRNQLSLFLLSGRHDLFTDVYNFTPRTSHYLVFYLFTLNSNFVLHSPFIYSLFTCAWMYSNMDLWNHPAIISIFWMCSHLGFFSYILSFQVLCVWVTIRLQFILPLFFRLLIRRKRKPGTTHSLSIYTSSMSIAWCIWSMSCVLL